MAKPAVSKTATIGSTPIPPAKRGYMHPAMIELYTWILTGHMANKKWTFNPDEIFFMNEHGSIWIGIDNPTGKLIQSKGIYKTLTESLKEDYITWSPLK